MRIFIYCWFITFSIGSSFASSVVEKREAVAKVYNAEIGTRELTGNNDGKRVEEYLAFVGFKKGASWCAAFVSWVGAQVKGVRYLVTAWSPSYGSSKFLVFKRGTKLKGVGQRGDVGTITGVVNGEWRISHVFFIDGLTKDGKLYRTVEGNTNSQGGRDGNGVFARLRSPNQIYTIADFISQ